MKFIVGNYYRTHGGMKARCLATDRNTGGCPLLFLTEGGDVFALNKHGIVPTSGARYINDIVGEWIEPPLVIEVGKHYRTRDGRRVTCLTIGRPAHSYPVVIMDSYGVLSSLTETGHVNMTSNTNSSDLVAKWTGTEVIIPWDDLPPHIIAWAMDKNGMQYYYTQVPLRLKDRWDNPDASDLSPYAGRTCYPPQEPEHEIKYEGDWKDCLQVRPL